MLDDTPMICQYHGKRSLELLCLENHCQSGERRGCRQCFNSNPTNPGKHKNHKFAELTEIYQELQQFSLSQCMEEVKQRAKESIALVHRELDDWYIQVVCKCENLENRYEGVGNINLNGDSLYEVYKLSTQSALAPITQGIIIFTQELLGFIQTHQAYLSRYFSEEYFNKKKDSVSRIQEIIKEIEKKQSELQRTSRESSSSNQDSYGNENINNLSQNNQLIHSDKEQQQLDSQSKSKQITTNATTAIPSSLIEQPTDISLKTIENLLTNYFVSLNSPQTSFNTSFQPDIQQLISQPFPFDLEELENPVDSHVYEFLEKTTSNGHVNLKQTTLTQLQDGLKNGRLFYFNTQGELYEGYVKDGLKHGKGKYCNIIQSQGYIGGFTGNKKSGFGMFVNLTEKQTQIFRERYEGYFLDDQYSGKGKIIYQNGDSIEGTFKKGLIHGKGRLTNAQGESVNLTWSHGEIQREDSEEQKRQLDKSEESEEIEEIDCREDISKD